MTTPPTQVGRYQLRGELGRGGMGVVYEAHDPELDRSVALKMLPPDLAEGTDWRQRFDREARLLATLAHPNIAAIHDLVTEAGHTYLVLEYVPGETLDDRLHRGAMPWREALEVASQVASGLSAAHESGVLHRDLKPANIRVRPDETVKILDFGVAKTLDAPGSSSPDRSAPTVDVNRGNTTDGVILGTPAYMSPEQARGRVVDRRSDVWAFGCVLFECLTGRQAFGGDTAAESIALVLERDLDWGDEPGDLPPRVRELVDRCLRKDSGRRLRDMADVQIEIEDILSGSTRMLATQPEGPRSALPPLGWALLPVLALGAFIGWFAGRDGPSASPDTEGPTYLSLTVPLLDVNLAISPDGSRIAVSGDHVEALGEYRSLYVRSLNDPELISIPGTRSAYSPTFSPDGEWIAFVQRGRLKKVPAKGGPLVDLGPAEPTTHGVWSSLDWGHPDSITYMPFYHGYLARLPAAGGNPERLTQLDMADRHFNHNDPFVLPGGDQFVFDIWRTSLNDSSIALGETATGRYEVLTGPGTSAKYGAGRLLFVRAGTLLAASLDRPGRRLLGEPLPVLDDQIFVSPGNGGAEWDVAQDGTLVYVARDQRPSRRQLEWVDGSGQRELVAAPPRHLVVAPEVWCDDDGRWRVAAILHEEDEFDAWFWEPGLADWQRCTRSGTVNQLAWAPDGKSLFVASYERGGLDIYRHELGSRSESKLLISNALDKHPDSCSPDEHYLLYTQDSSETDADIHILDLTTGKSRPFIQTPTAELGARISPDGHWVAFQAQEGDVMEIMVEAFPDLGGRPLKVSSGGGYSPRWSSDSGVLYYLAGEKERSIVAVPLQVEGARLSPGPSRRVVDVPADATDWDYALGRDGRVLLTKEDVRLSRGTRIDVILNFFETLPKD